MPNALPFSIKVSNRFKNPDGRMQVLGFYLHTRRGNESLLTGGNGPELLCSKQHASLCPLLSHRSGNLRLHFSAQRNPGSSVSGANNLLHVPKAVSSHARGYMHCTRSSEGKRNLLRDFTPKQLQRTLEASFPSVPRRAKR